MFRSAESFFWRSMLVLVQSFSVFVGGPDPLQTPGFKRARRDAREKGERIPADMASWFVGYRGR